MSRSALWTAGWLWLASTPVGAAAATTQFVLTQGSSTARQGAEPGFEPVLVVFWAVLVLLIFGGRAVAAIVMARSCEDLSRSFLLLLGPFAALVNDSAAIAESDGRWWVIALAALDLMLVAAATAASYRPESNRLIAESLRARARALHPNTSGPASAAAAPDRTELTGVAGAGPPVNAYAIVAIALAFAFPMLGPVFGVTARNQIRYSREQGAGLALVGILVPLALLVVMGLLFTLVASVDSNVAS